MRRLCCLIALLLTACQPGGPLDIDALEAQARAGDERAVTQLVEALGSDQPGVDGRAYQALLRIGVPAVGSLRRAAGSADADRREHVLAALGTLQSTAAVPEIVAALQDTGLSRRYVAAWALGEIGSADAIPALIAALGDPDAEVRKYATRALIRFNQAALAPLLAALQQSSGEAAAGAIRALGDIGDKRALPALMARAGGAQRLDAIRALGKLKDPRAEAVLVAALNHADWQVRMQAAMAIGPLGGPAAVAPLRVTLDDPERVVREWAARSLEMITGEHVPYRNAQGEMVLPYNIYH